MKIEIPAWLYNFWYEKVLVGVLLLVVFAILLFNKLLPGRDRSVPSNE